VKARAFTESQIQRSLRGSLSRYQLQRFAIAAIPLGLAIAESSSLQLRDLEPLASDSSLSPEKRAGLLLLILRGTYPTRDEFEPVLKSLAQTNWQRALAQAANGLDAKIELITSDADVVDVTRFSAQRRISGIPRVVKNLAYSEAFGAAILGVWELGALGVGIKGQSGRVEFSKRHWRRGHNRKSRLMSVYIQLSNRIGRTRLGVWVLQQFSTSFLPMVYRYINRPRLAKVSILLSGQRYFLPEVPSEDTSNRLSVWKRVFPETELRVIVHDLLPLSHPEFFPPSNNREHLYFSRMLVQADRIFVATEVLKNEVNSLLPLYGASSVMTTVLPLPLTYLPKGEVSAGIEIAEPYFLFFGGFEKRKALSDLVDFLESRPLGTIPFRILILGAPWPEQGPEVWTTAQRVLRLPQIFKILGPVNDLQLRQLIDTARGILYLSHAEGYGLPILESLAFGKVVLVQDTPTNRELAAKHNGIWTNFRFDSESSFEAMLALVEAHDEFAVLGLKRPRLEDLPTSTHDWAQEIAGS